MKFLLVALALVSCCHLVANLATFDQLPATRRVEGRVTLEYVEGERRVKQKLIFTEVTDETTHRSKVTIGHVSFDPKIYYTYFKTLLTVDSLNKQCVKLPDTTKILPELDFFLMYSYTEQEIVRDLPEVRLNCHSPSVLALMHLDKACDYDHSEMHRGVTCSVMSTRIERSKSDKPINFEVFQPKTVPITFEKTPLFSIRETVDDIQKTDSFGKFSTKITVDFFYIEEIDKKNLHQLAKLEEELSLPLGAGCSDFIEETKLNLPLDAKSFMMTYIKESSNDLISLAYDHEFGYLRKEQHGKSVAIWDLNEDILYHSHRSMNGKMYSGSEIALLPCSVIRFDDTQQQHLTVIDGHEEVFYQISRPYERAGESLAVFKFLGFDKVYYMGESTVRDLPCMVFETILDKPPKIFEMEIQNQAKYYGQGKHDYIVQFHVLKSTITDNNNNRPNEDLKFPEGQAAYMFAGNNHYWPAKIKIYLRYHKPVWVKLLESIYVEDFHWGLYGWQGKPSELFMMPKCFNDEDEQLKVEISLDLKQTTPAKRQNIFANYKYKFELDLLNDLFKSLKISRLHLTEYNVALMRHNIIANLVLSDRLDCKKLSYFGEGQLVDDKAYAGHKIELQDNFQTNLDECLMAASHIDGVSMVIFCPGKDGVKNRCTVIYAESEPAIKLYDTTSTQPGAHAQDCQVFRYEPAAAPKAVTNYNNVDIFKKAISNFKFNFILSDVSEGFDHRNEAESVEVIVGDFDVTHEQQLITLSNYRFAVPQSSSRPGDLTNVRYISSITYDTHGDCSRMCNLDSSCRSFSYCLPSGVKENEGRCVLSSLELRQNNIQQQLTRANVTNAQVIVMDLEQAKRYSTLASSEYLLDLRGGCTIYERDFMSMFTRTNEFLRIEASLAKQFQTTSSATECARLVVNLENMEESHHGAFFAYCARLGTCLNDENLFGTLEGVESDSISDEDESQRDEQQGLRELSCQVFRKRYQTYFHMSAKVVKGSIDQERNEPNKELDQREQVRLVRGGIKQIELGNRSVEECARACWNSFGHVCVSFDFCSPLLCIINSIEGPDDSTTAYDPAAVEYETRQNCLGYTRDLKWDQLRRDHLIGKHNILIDFGSRAEGANQGSHGLGWWFWNLILLGVVVVLFDVGLVVGRNLNDRLNGVNGGHNSRLNENESTTSNTMYNIENEIYSDGNVIQLDEMGESRNHTSSNGQTDQTSASGQASASTASFDVPNLGGETCPQPVWTKKVIGPTSRRPGHIDVPSLT